MSINQLVYVSQATRKMSPSDLAGIQDTAKNNNAPLDVTGSLFYNGGWFLQVLEGPVETLTSCTTRSNSIRATRIRAFSITNQPSFAHSRAGA